MIKTEREYKDTKELIRRREEAFIVSAADLAARGYTPEQVTKLHEAMRTFHLGMVEEVEYYERLKRGDIGAVQGIRALGKHLIALRIAAGITQRELARRMDVHESQVSRDEHDDYHGITLGRAESIARALGFALEYQARRRTPEDGPGGPGDLPPTA
ncbi:MAG: helix-turn-helix transcriptional regulator [Candidatus Eisenbacteria bacterium]